MTYTPRSLSGEGGVLLIANPQKILVVVLYMLEITFLPSPRPPDVPYTSRRAPIHHSKLIYFYSCSAGYDNNKPVFFFLGNNLPPVHCLTIVMH